MSENFQQDNYMSRKDYEASIGYGEARQLKSVCDEFKSALHSGASPRIEDFLSRIEPRLQEHAFAKLLALELEYAGDSDSNAAKVQGDYESRFPQHANVVSDLIVDEDRPLTDSDIRATGPSTHGMQLEETVEFSGDQDDKDDRAGAEASLPGNKRVPEEYCSFLSDAERPDELGRLGSYRILAVMGVGGMGIVYKAEDISQRQLVALKVMKPKLAVKSRAKKRFLREARAAAAIEHENIIHIHEVGEENNVPYIAMGYLSGETLQRKIFREGRVDARIVAKIGSQVAAGLEAAHVQGLIHRDIKPDNIWIQEGSEDVKILDFGLARSNEPNARLTQAGTVVGTPKYMSPEQAHAKDIDHRSDLFSLGSVLYHLLSGEAPFADTTVTATLVKVTKVDYEPIQKVRPDLNPEFAKYVSRMLQREPKRRPQSAQEVSDALKKIHDKLEAQWHRQRSAETVDLASAESTSDANTQESQNAAEPAGSAIRRFKQMFVPGKPKRK